MTKINLVTIIIKKLIISEKKIDLKHFKKKSWLYTQLSCYLSIDIFNQLHNEIFIIFMAKFMIKHNFSR